MRRLAWLLLPVMACAIAPGQPPSTAATPYDAAERGLAFVPPQRCPALVGDVGEFPLSRLVVAESATVDDLQRWPSAIAVRPGMKRVRYQLHNGPTLDELAPLIVQARPPAGVMSAQAAVSHEHASQEMKPRHEAYRCDRDARDYVPAPFRFSEAVVEQDARNEPAQDAASVPEPDSDRFDAYTHYWWRWGHAGLVVTDDGQRKYDPAGLWGTLSSRMRLPRPPTEHARLAPAWNAYLCQLVAHESLHLEVGRLAARHMLETLATLSARDESELHAKAKRLNDAVVAWEANESARLDALTCHGPPKFAVETVR